eukprot:COSAG02_NODE_27252_length_613_cov_580.079767_2_plen_68_part_00
MAVNVGSPSTNLAHLCGGYVARQPPTLLIGRQLTGLNGRLPGKQLGAYARQLYSGAETLGRNLLKQP